MIRRSSINRRQFIASATAGSFALPVLAARIGAHSAKAAQTSAAATLTVAQDTAFAVLDPAGAGKVRAEPEIIRHLYNNLVRFKPDMSIEPDLATSWSVSTDQLTWTFKLRSGVKFHDGTDVTSDAVKFTFERLLATQNAFLNRGLFASVIASVKVVDPTTLSIVTQVPFGPILNYLAHHSAGIVSPTAVQKYGNEFGLHPIGTGPYRAQEIVPGDHAALTRNPSFFGTQPLTAKLNFRSIVEDGARTAALESGQVDIATGVPAQDAARLKGTKITIAAAPSLQAQYLGINVQRPHLGDVRVRQALNYAIDKSALVKSIFLDTVTIADSVLTPGTFGYQSQEVYAYGQDKAKNLLTSAGLGSANPLRLILWTPTGLYPKDTVVAQAIQSMLKGVGVEVTIQQQESASYFTALKKPTSEANYDLFMWAFVPSTGDGYQTLQNNLLSDAGDLPSYFNFSRYRNPQFDQLVKQAGDETDQQKRASALAQAQKIAWTDVPYAYLYVIGIVNGYQKDVTGVVALPTRYMDLTQARKG